MSTGTREILDRVMELPAMEKARLIDQLLSSLDEPDETIDALWRKGSGRSYPGISSWRPKVSFTVGCPRKIPQVDGNSIS
jgi:hypothetical protein